MLLKQLRVPNRVLPPTNFCLAAAVVPGLLDAMAVAEGEGDPEGRETWRRRLFNYLDKVFMVSSVSCKT
jgi:hypothetical protein